LLNNIQKQKHLPGVAISLVGMQEQSKNLFLGRQGNAWQYFTLPRKASTQGEPFWFKML
jgi:hypothetical protein